MAQSNKNVCQSCGMPLKRDEKGGGSNADGSISTEYCSLCYENGEFLQPNITADEMVTFVQGKLREMRFPDFVAKWMTRGIPALRRWSS